MTIRGVHLGSLDTQSCHVTELLGLASRFNASISGLAACVLLAGMFPSTWPFYLNLGNRVAVVDIFMKCTYMLESI